MNSHEKELYIIIKDIIFDTAASKVHFNYDTESRKIEWLFIDSNFIYTDNSSRKWLDQCSYGICSYIPENAQDWQELVDCIKDKEWILHKDNGSDETIQDETFKAEIIQQMLSK